MKSSFEKKSHLGTRLACRLQTRDGRFLARAFNSRFQWTDDSNEPGLSARELEKERKTSFLKSSFSIFFLILTFKDFILSF